MSFKLRRFSAPFGIVKINLRNWCLQFLCAYVRSQLQKSIHSLHICSMFLSSRGRKNIANMTHTKFIIGTTTRWQQKIVKRATIDCGSTCCWFSCGNECKNLRKFERIFLILQQFSTQKLKTSASRCCRHSLTTSTSSCVLPLPLTSSLWCNLVN